MGKTDAELWRGDPNEFEFRSRQRQRITSEHVESAFISARHPFSSSIGMLERLAPYLQYFTDDALQAYGNHLQESDPQMAPFITEIFRRGCFHIETRSAVLKPLLKFMQDRQFESHAVSAWNQIHRHRIFNESGYAPVFDDLEPFKSQLARLDMR